MRIREFFLTDRGVAPAEASEEARLEVDRRDRKRRGGEAVVAAQVPRHTVA